MSAAARLMLIFFDESDRWGDPPIPLYEAVVRVLMEQGIAGATVLRGIMGYGAVNELHRSGLFGISPDRPVTLLCIDQEDKLRAVMPQLAPMITEGLVFLVAGELLHPSHGSDAL